MNIIGISSFFHDSACCLLKDGVLVAAAEEERFTRIKADPSFPLKAFQYCLRAGGINVGDVDCIAYYEDPKKKLARQLWSGVIDRVPDWRTRLDPHRVEFEIREKTGFTGPVKYFDHHLSHAASSFYFSGFTEAAVLTVDGVGEWATTTYGVGSSNDLQVVEEVQFPHSLGLLYSTITSYLGFGVNDGEYKVMGLAPYGQPTYVDQIHKLIKTEENGQYRLDMRYFGFLTADCMYTDELCTLLGGPPRKEDSELTRYHMDLAKSMQVVLEEVLIEKANYLYKRTKMSDLCMAGGVALNCVANGQILRNSPFKRLYVQPAANDAGGAIGAAALAHVEYMGVRPDQDRLDSVYLGPAYTSERIYPLLQSTGVRYHDCRNDGDRLLQLAAEKLAEGKVVGWFQGRMEFGPRSLGARSILADPRHPEMRDRINAMVKKRESFRPFAPAVLDYKAKDHFDLDHGSPFMLETCQVTSRLDLPAITHVDGSARVQTVHRTTNQRFYDLLRAFDRLTGCPILLNTSFNVKGEPIVCTPEDAINCFIMSGIDYLVIEDFAIDLSENNFDRLEFVLRNRWFSKTGIRDDIYTFI
jgi:carbamoyltransferase